MAEEKTTVEQETEAEDTVLDEQTGQPASEEAAGESETVAEEASAGEAEKTAENEETAAEQDGGEPEEAQSSKGEKKNPFKKKEKKKDKRDERIEELTDQVKRQMAEFENFRRRTEKEKTQMFDMGAKNVLEKILPVVDNFERGLATPIVDEADQPFADGMQMIYKQLMKQLEDLGVKPIEAIGKEFDPNFHNAVMQVESEEYETGFVAQELQKGYLYKDTVIRHSMVAVVS